MRLEDNDRSIRARALDRLDQETPDWDEGTVDARKLVQELRIHQIELEIQNEELRQAQQRLSEVVEQYSDLYEFAPIGYLALDKYTAIRRINLTAATMLGVSREKLIDKPLITRMPSRYHTVLNTHVRAVLGSNQPPACELEIVRPDARRVWVALSSTLESAAGAEPLCRVTLTDITVLKQMERALRDNEEKYRLIAENTVDCIWQMDMELRFRYVNAAVLSALGYPQNEWVGSNLADHCPLPDLNRIKTLIAEAIARGNGSGITFEADLYHRNGHLIPFEIMGKVLFDERQEPAGIQGVARDISERKRAEEEIRKFKMLAESANYGVLIVNLTGQINYCNAAFAEMHGYRVDEVVGSFLESLQSKAEWHPVEAASSEAPEYRELSAREMKHRRKDGTDFDVLLSCTLVRHETGEPFFLAITATDITELKSLEGQLLQAQKMEAIGQLVGGVAHDFNNLLTIIVNRADFIHDALSEGSASRDDAVEIAEAGMRGAALIRQLLAFSRKQHLNIQCIDTNDILRGVERMLKRLIGEDISLAMELTSAPCVISADAGQLEQVIINLAVNARDAMPGGGLLTITTYQVCMLPEDMTGTSDPEQPPPGRYVALSFSDTGYGMDPATQAQIFDPFFTTKDVGQGTGLGLSTVYGIIRQHRGFVQVHSETAKGTTFRILLPSQEQAAEELNRVIGNTPLPRGSETILLVDDDAAVRRVSARMLRDLGYRVLEAGGGQDGLRHAHRYKHEIELLLTDIVMPEMDGKQLAEQAAALIPDLKVIFISGYPEAHLKLRNAWVKNRPLLQKPFFIAELATGVRQTLDAQ